MLLLFLSHLLKWHMFWGTLKARFSIHKNACAKFLSILPAKPALLHNCLHSLETHTASLQLHAQTRMFKMYLFLPYKLKSSELEKKEMFLFLFRCCQLMLTAQCTAGQPWQLAALGAMMAAIQSLIPATPALHQTKELSARGRKLVQVASLQPC